MVREDPNRYHYRFNMYHFTHLVGKFFLVYYTPGMYADDTSLTLGTSDLIDLKSKLNNDLAEIQTWLQANKLKLCSIGINRLRLKRLKRSIGKYQPFQPKPVAVEIKRT